MSTTATRSVWDIAADIVDPRGSAMSGWEPFPKQRIAERLSREVDELLFGGAAGPGKTEWGLEHCIAEMERHPRNRGVIFRRVHPSLTRSVLPRLHAKLPPGRARWRGDEHTFTFPNGSVLELGHLQHAGGSNAMTAASHLSYQGAEYGVIFFEEVTEFEEQQFEYMLGRLRPPDLDSGIRPHVIATTNPGGTGHAWVKRRWVRPRPDDVDGEPPQPGEVWRPKPNDEQPNPGTRAFVPATMADNPKLLEKDPTYLDRLRANSNRGLRRAMEYGDWDAIDAVEGALWLQSWLDAGRVRTAPPSQRRAVAVDPSEGNEGGDAYGVWWGSLGVDGVGYTEGAEAWRMPPGSMVRRTIELARDVGADVIVVERNNGGKWLRESLRNKDPYANVHMVWASEGKRTRAEPVAALHEPDRDDLKLPVRAKLVGYHPDLEDQLTSFTGAAGEESPDMLDALVWGLTELVLGRSLVHRSQADDQRLAGRR